MCFVGPGRQHRFPDEVPVVVEQERHFPGLDCCHSALAGMPAFDPLADIPSRSNITTQPRPASAWADLLQRGSNPFVQRGGRKLAAPDGQDFSVRPDQKLQRQAQHAAI